MTTGISISRRSANGSVQWLAGGVPELTLQLSPGATLTDNPAALTFYGGSTAPITIIDLKGMEQARLTARVVTTSASANTPQLRLLYLTTFNATVGNWLQIGKAGHLNASLFTGQTVADSGWVDLADLARVDNCYIALATIGGDGAADPVTGLVTVNFR